MKRLAQRTIKVGEFKGEKIRIMELSVKEKIEIGANYVVTFGDYNDIDAEFDSLDEARSFFDNWEK